MKAELLTEDAIERGLALLPATWQVEGLELVKEFRFPSYMAGIEFVQRIAALAEAMNHHPDLLIGWRKVSVRLCTHSAGGLTALDFAMAAQVSQTASDQSSQQGQDD
ncbi:4a-hydroxytetrahydrobiopterin dehydratase [Prosthecobacter sp.]|uniref:4a-hydroxytetrahydrobiopterin dehydratase n=1 Tax=Prosthecobacter sp. TaxID=1965333 RepID=UPI003784E99D